MLVASTVLALAALVAANPVPEPQLINLASVAAQGAPPQPTITIGATRVVVTFDPTKAASSVAASITAEPVTAAKRDLTYEVLGRRQADCASLASGYGPVVSPDSPSAFTANTAMAAAASSAPIPKGYVQTFQNLQASNNANGYLGYTTMKTYDTQACASMCDVMNGCAAVNVYFERDPSVLPAANCSNPSSTNQIKCVFWGGPVNAANAVNNGQYMDDFHVVMAGSNGYVNQTVDDCPGYTGPNYLGSAAINAPGCSSMGVGSYMGYVLFNDGSPFDTGKCAAACSAQSDYARAHPNANGSPAQTCQFFNTYILNKNNVPQGQYCSLYASSWDASYATNNGQYDNEGNHYTISYSYSFTNSTNAGVCN